MLTDTSKMPFGKYMGTALADVSDDYLLWLYNNGKCSGELRQYIKENIKEIKANISRKPNSHEKKE